MVKLKKNKYFMLLFALYIMLVFFMSNIHNYKHHTLVVDCDSSCVVYNFEKNLVKNSDFYYCVALILFFAAIFVVCKSFDGSFINKYFYSNAPPLFVTFG